MSDASVLLAGLIDHMLLKPEAGAVDISRYCAETLDDSAVATCAVVGFPLGATLRAAKVAETAHAVAAGADEIDMVLPIGRLRDGDRAAVAEDIAAVRHTCDGRLLKVIIEACLPDEGQKIAACEIARDAGADYVKTSTGFAAGGATAADVALMRATVGTGLGVKASGGIRTRADALAMIKAGATRIGASSGMALIETGS